MHTTSLEISKRLFEVSGWKNTNKSWFRSDMLLTGTNGEYKLQGYVKDADLVKEFSQIPAYDSGYLLRKLPIRISGGKWSFMMWKQWHNGRQCNWYTVSYVHINSSLANSPDEAQHKVHTCEADTPEDALALLAIKLFEEEVLK